MTDKCNRTLEKLDKGPLWIAGVFLFVLTFSLYFLMGEDCVFVIHDQLDDSILNYVLPARHLWEENLTRFPEILGGVVQTTGMQPADMLAIFLYHYLTPFYAFLLQYAYVFLWAFFGMYLCVKEFSQSSILSAAMGGCFCMLPLYSIYGLSMYGIPMVLYALICLYKGKGLLKSYGAIALFGISSHLVCTGYVVLGFLSLTILILLFMKKQWKWLGVGLAELAIVYIIVNRQLFSEFLLGNVSYVSHREEMIKYGTTFWEGVRECFINSAMHADSLHKYLIVPVIVILIVGFSMRKTEKYRLTHNFALAGFAVLVLTALFYGFCNSSVGAGLRNACSGFLHYFQAERVYWLYPAGWYLEFALAVSVFWPTYTSGESRRKTYLPASVTLMVILLPTMLLIFSKSNFYRNISQAVKGEQTIGHVSWESYYAEELMETIEQAIGRDMSTYRVAHLGISSTPSLMHGFYTVDGYSNNYPLEYKHKFRQVIAKEIEKNEETRIYFDDWGSRCYLFNSQTGYFYDLAKGNEVVYQGLEFDMDALRELGCEYIFSGARIEDEEKMGLDFMGYFETATSYWGIWLYALQES